jgi:predicted Zn-dependent protease
VAGDLARFRWADAARTLDDWLDREPDDTTALLLRGKLQEQRQDAEGAAAAYRRVLALDPDHDEARLRLATVLLQRYYGEEALPHLEFLRRRLPDSPEVAYQWAVALGLQGRSAEARAALDELLRAHPDQAAARAARARYAAQDGDDAAALDDLARAVRLDPGDLTVRHQYAQALTRAGRAAEAAREQQAVDRMKGDLERMSQLIAGPLQSAPNDPAVHHQIALIALRSGRPADGVRWLRGALQVDPDHLPSHQALAAYYQASGNPVLAARHRAIASRLAAGR